MHTNGAADKARTPQRADPWWRFRRAAGPFTACRAASFPASSGPPAAARPISRAALRQDGQRRRVSSRRPGWPRPGRALDRDWRERPGRETAREPARPGSSDRTDPARRLRTDRRLNLSRRFRSRNPNRLRRLGRSPSPGPPRRTRHRTQPRTTVCVSWRVSRTVPPSRALSRTTRHGAAEGGEADQRHRPDGRLGRRGDQGLIVRANRDQGANV